MQRRILQHTAMTVGEQKTVAPRPLRVGRIMVQEIVVEHFGNVRHTHRHAGMTGIGLLDGIHGQHPNGVGKFAACRHGESPSEEALLSPTTGSRATGASGSGVDGAVNRLEGWRYRYHWRSVSSFLHGWPPPHRGSPGTGDTPCQTGFWPAPGVRCLRPPPSDRDRWPVK